MNYTNNLYKRYLSKLIQNDQSKNLSSSGINDILLNKILVNSKFATKNRNKKNIFENKIINRISKNFSMDSIGNKNKFELNKTIAIKNVKLNFIKKQFPKIIQNNKKIENKFENLNLKIINKEKAKENLMKTTNYYHKLLKIYKLKEILSIKKKHKQKLEKINFENNSKKENGLNRFIIHISDKYSKSQDMKLLSLRKKKADDESEEDDDKIEQNFYKLIRKVKHRKGNDSKNNNDDPIQQRFGKMKSFNSSFKRIGMILFKQKEKQILGKTGRIPNKRHQIFHNEILYQTIKYRTKGN